MQKLVLLYWGCIFLMYLSDVYYPYDALAAGNGRRPYRKCRTDVFMFVAIAWMTCFMFLRTWYNDTGNYIWEWENLTFPLKEFLQSGQLFQLGGNPFFKLYKTCLHELTDNYHMFFFFPAVLSCLSVIRFLKKYSIDPAYSLLIFFSIGTYIMYLAAMKQCIAIAVLFYALPFAIEKKYVKFWALVLLAMMFHTHAFIFLFVPLLFGRPWGKMTWCMLALVLLAMATYNVTFGALMNFALSIGVNVADIEVFDGHSIHPLRVVVYGIPAMMALIFRNRLFRDSSRQENLFVNMSIVSFFILSIGLRQGANLFARMAAYYEVAISLSLPWMIRKLFTRQSATLVKIISCTMFFGYFLYEFGVSKSFGSGYFAISLWDFILEMLG